MVIAIKLLPSERPTKVAAALFSQTWAPADKRFKGSVTNILNKGYIRGIDRCNASFSRKRMCILSGLSYPLSPGITSESRHLA